MTYHRIEKTGLRPKIKPPWEKPEAPYILLETIVARCPACGRIVELRTCYGCKAIMCYNCLIEHSIACLHSPVETM